MSVVKQLAVLSCLIAMVGAIVYLKFGDANTINNNTPAALIEAEDVAVPVIVRNVEYESAAAVVEAVGSGEAIQAVTIYPEAAGRVTDIRFRAGQRVEKGDALLMLDDDEEKLAVELAEVELEDLRRQLDRYESTISSGAVSSSEVDSSRAAAAAAKIRLSQAELSLHRRTLRAPFSGVVSIPGVDIGDRVTTTTPITTLDDRSSLLVDFEVPEAYSNGVHPEMKITATTWALPGIEFDGLIDSLASRIDQQTRTLRVRARIENADDRLRTGMSFIIRLPLQGNQYPSVPSIAVQWDRTGPYIWRVTDGRAQRINVDVMKREKQWILVDADISPGDQIVIEGVQRLREGRAVSTITDDEIAAGNTSTNDT